VLSERGARWASRILLLVLWQLAGLLTDRFPTPLGTIQFLVEEAQRPFIRTEPLSFWNNELVANLRISLGRTAIGLVWVAIIGIPLGYMMGRWWRMQALFTDLIMVGIALPAYIWALLAIMWFGFGYQAPLFTIVVSATPALVVHVMQGALSIPTDLKDMSGAYQVPVVQRTRHLILPAMAGAVIAGFRLAILAAWGVTMLVEWFGQNEGVGQRARLWYDSAVFTGLLGWGLVIIVVVITFDRGIVERIDKSVHKWRSAHAGFGRAKARV
jgi:ABC-type nitrate/sulfonate/bicarbonate transport system permease component